MAVVVVSEILRVRILEKTKRSSSSSCSDKNMESNEKNLKKHKILLTIEVLQQFYFSEGNLLMFCKVDITSPG